MKLSDCITEYQQTGECKIDIDNVVRCWKRTKTTFIKRYCNAELGKEDYRLVNFKAGIKVTISKDDALELIRRLNLTGQQHYLFVNVSIYARHADAA